MRCGYPYSHSASLTSPAPYLACEPSKGSSQRHALERRSISFHRLALSPVHADNAHAPHNAFSLCFPAALTCFVECFSAFDPLCVYVCVLQPD